MAAGTATVIGGQRGLPVLTMGGKVHAPGAGGPGSPFARLLGAVGNSQDRLLWAFSRRPARARPSEVRRGPEKRLIASGPPR